LIGYDDCDQFGLGRVHALRIVGEDLDAKPLAKIKQADDHVGEFLGKVTVIKWPPPDDLDRLGNLGVCERQAGDDLAPLSGPRRRGPTIRGVHRADANLNRS
jgi:hypothetical protein